MKNFYTLLILTSFFFVTLDAQQYQSPKLVVGIVIDQMRAEYLNRFYNQFGENGLKRLMKEGFNCRNVHYNYIPTITGPGHTSIYSGTTPTHMVLFLTTGTTDNSNAGFIVLKIPTNVPWGLKIARRVSRHEIFLVPISLTNLKFQQIRMQK